MRKLRLNDVAKMTEKSKLRWLGKIWTAEVLDRLPFQAIREKQAEELVSEGLIQPMTTTFGGRFHVTIKGYQLTHAGRLIFCASCDEPEKVKP